MSEPQSAVPRGGKKRIDKRKGTLFDLFLRHADPRKWSLRARFLYFTGLLLILGNAILIFVSAYNLDRSIDKISKERLRILETSVRHEMDRSRSFLMSQALSAASVPVVKRALAEQDRESLRDFILTYSDRIRLNIELTSLNYHFHIPPGKLLLSTQNVNARGEDFSDDELISRVNQELSPAFGLDVQQDIPVFRALSPVLHKDTHVGGIEVSLSLIQALEHTPLSVNEGIAFYSFVPQAPADEQEPEAPASWSLIKRISSLSIEADEIDFSRSGIQQSGEIFTTFIPLSDYSNNKKVGLLLAYDSSDLLREKMNTLYELFWLFIVGALLLWIFLLINVNRIQRFLRRLKKIIIASHSNDFRERFESDTVHCLEVMHCHNEECPVYINPSLVCYLETGSEAISPRWRNTCIFLNKYEECSKCPVYGMRKGDEISEMRNVVNTMMRLWGRFLSRTGHLLSYVLRSQVQAGQLPSLDEVSDRLEQMAKLTFFSHDLQGVKDKEEVYQHLAFAFSNNFGLKEFIIFEVDDINSQARLVLDNAEDRELCKGEIISSIDTCRAKRVAEDVSSFYNPVLCPHFNCDHDKEIRCCLPIVMSGHVGAVLSFVARKEQWPSIRERLPIIRKYLDESGPVLSSLHLLRLSQEQALRDPLTQCHNRRFLDEFITKYEPLTEREGTNTGFLMADIDFFKQVNDEYGHEAGDSILRQVAATMRGCIRRSDLLIRYGGEEFLVLLQDVQNNTSFKVAEKIRISVEQSLFEVAAGVRIRKTISIGVSEFPSDAQSLYKAIKFADVALYAAKNRGRNKVIRFEAEMWKDEEY